MKKWFIEAFFLAVGMIVYGQPMNDFEDQSFEVHAYINSGNWYFILGDFDCAFADYDKAIELDPANFFVYATRGNAYYMRRDYDKSIVDYTYAATLLNGKARADMLYALAVVYAAKGDQEQAEKNLNEAKRLNPSYYKKNEPDLYAPFKNDGNTKL